MVAVFKSWFQGTSNKITMSRIVGTPLLFLLFAPQWVALRYIGAFLFGILMLTDALDGYLARKQGDLSEEGAILDPVADKILVLCGLLILVSLKEIYAWMAFVLIARDMMVSSLRQLSLKKGLEIKVKYSGKIKTLLVAIAIFFLLLPETTQFDWRTLGFVTLWIGLLFSLYSGYEYFKMYAQRLKHPPL